MRFGLVIVSLKPTVLIVGFNSLFWFEHCWRALVSALAGSNIGIDGISRNDR